MTDKDDAVTGALTRSWRKIQSLEPAVPNAVWYLTSGRSSSCATGPWNTPDELVLRVNLRTRDANRSGRELLGQLLHWAAHAATGISTGAEGRYHSREFGEIAGRLGLRIEHVAGLGWAPVTILTGAMTQGGSIHRAEVLTPRAQARFQSEIRALDEAMGRWEPEPDETARKEGRGPVSMACWCRPPRVLRVSTGVALGAGIRCEKCKRLFRISPGQRISEADRAAVRR